MNQDIIEYIKRCDEYQRNKIRRYKRYRNLLPLELPYRPWKSISMDFIVDLPESKGKTQVWVIVDRFSKMVHFIPLPTKVNAQYLAQEFLKNVWRLHGIPTDIVSDRDPKFTSEFWKELMRLLKVDLRMNTTNHPETDGQTEMVNQV